MQDSSLSEESNRPRRPTTIDRLGATYVGGNATFFRVWAPKSKSVRVVFAGDDHRSSFPLQRDGNGYHSGLCDDAPIGADYFYELSSGARRPDPASVYQPYGVHRESRIVDHGSYEWQDSSWRGVPTNELIIYELHLGTFTTEGTFEGAKRVLPYLLDLGVNAVELMPLAQTPGRWNWGYDGVGLYAVNHNYGTPDDLKAFVDACHAVDLSVILDVVYNHLGPEGNYLGEFGPYFSRKHKTPWGQAWNFDGKRSKPVREFVIDNALRWLNEFHFDGLRLDASHFILDDSADHVLSELRRTVGNCKDLTDRHIHLIAESNVLDRELLVQCNPETPSFEAIWCDDLMHTIYSYLVPELRLTDRSYEGLSDIEKVLKAGHLYEYEARHRIKRSFTDVSEAVIPDVEKLVVALQTHDAVGNQPRGERIHHLTNGRTQKAAAALTLLFSAIPLIFMGEEHASTTRFPFFVDFEDPDLRRRVDVGRANEYPRHEWKGALSPSDPMAFRTANCSERPSDDDTVYDWYQRLLGLRKQLKTRGWLRHEFVNVETDSVSGVIRLSYLPSPECGIMVVTRLRPLNMDDPTISEPYSMALPVGSKVILDSDAPKAVARIHSTPVTVEPDQAIVISRGFEQVPLS